MFEDNGNKCGKCQNHDFEVLKKGHARDCPFKKCNCLKCRLLDARSDILQVISGKETKLKGTKKDPNCGFCQNHGVKILRKGHVRSCSFGQERHFRLDNCFDCEVHYIRNEVNRLQIKMRRAMKEDRTLSEEQRKTAREAITRDEVEKVCDMARLARKKRESILAQQVGEPSAQASSSGPQHSPPSSSAPMAVKRPKVEHELARQTGGVWRPWSQHQVAAAMARHQPQPHQLHQPGPLNGLLIATEMHQVAPLPPPPPPQPSLPPQPQAPNNFFMSSLQVAHQQHQLLERQQQHRNLILEEQLGVADDISNGGQQSPPPTPPEQPLALIRPNLHEQQLFNTLFRLIVAQFGQPTPTNL